MNKYLADYAQELRAMGVDEQEAQFALEDFAAGLAAVRGQIRADLQALKEVANDNGEIYALALASYLVEKWR